MRVRSRGSIVPACALAAVLLLGAAGARGEATPKADDKTPAGVKPIPTEMVKSKPGSRFGTVEQQPFTQSTRVSGKIDADLSGVWLLVSNVEVAPGKFRNFPLLLKISQGKDGPQFNLLDVRLPESVEQSVKAAKVDRWRPSPEMRAMLAAEWSKLPPFKDKTINDMMYDKVIYELADPAHYSEFGPKDPKLDKALEGSKFGLRLSENYRPRELPTDVAITQLAQRITIYGFKKIGKDTLEGELLAGFVAVGIGMPLPFTFNGPFVMYRLAA